MDLLMQGTALFHKGGLVMYPLLLCSLAVVTIAVERFYYYRQARTDVESLIRDLHPSLRRGDWDQAIAICEQAKGVTALVLAKALKRRSRDVKLLESAMEGAASLAAARLKERLNYLDAIVTMAPLLGLLGTVIGMIQSFSIMNIREGQPFAITGGVGEALVATATGLCVAIMSLIVYTYFNQQMDSIITDMEQACDFLIDGVNRGESVETA